MHGLLTTIVVYDIVRSTQSNWLVDGALTRNKKKTGSELPLYSPACGITSQYSAETCPTNVSVSVCPRQPMIPQMRTGTHHQELEQSFVIFFEPNSLEGWENTFTIATPTGVQFHHCIRWGYLRIPWKTIYCVSSSCRSISNVRESPFNPGWAKSSDSCSLDSTSYCKGGCLDAMFAQ